MYLLRITLSRTRTVIQLSSQPKVHTHFAPVLPNTQRNAYAFRDLQTVLQGKYKRIDLAQVNTIVVCELKSTQRITSRSSPAHQTNVLTIISRMFIMTLNIEIDIYDKNVRRNFIRDCVRKVKENYGFYNSQLISNISLRNDDRSL